MIVFKLSSEHLRAAYQIF